MKLIGYRRAIELVIDSINPVSGESVPLEKCTDRVLFQDLLARVDSPSVNASLMDGYAVRADDIEKAEEGRPISLKVSGMAAAGDRIERQVISGEAVRVLTGARLPKGADAVVPDEDIHLNGERISIFRNFEKGKNILPRGSDISVGEMVVPAGSRLAPGRAGLLAAAGYGEVPVFKKVRVAVISTGDEVVAPGKPLPEGKLFASNMVTLNAWCQRYKMETNMDVVPDKLSILEVKLGHALERYDAVLTSGGAWFGDRDMVAKVFDKLGWEKVFHRLRMGPGKAAGFGMFNEKPVFILPGGPPSNLIAFLELAMPGLLKLAGHRNPGLPEITVILEKALRGVPEWTQFVFGTIEVKNDGTLFSPLRGKSRLQSMAKAEAVVEIPEGVEGFQEGLEVRAQLVI